MNLDEKKVLRTNFAKFVSQNIVGMIGISCYILADTFFISKASGSEGITILNLCLPIYNFIAAMGCMIGVGSAIEFSVEKARNSEKTDVFFTNASFFALVFGFIVMLLGLTVPDKLLFLMGGRGKIIIDGIPYIRTFMFFGPTSVLYHVIDAFVRNDDDPFLAMIATFAGSLFNIVFDYIFMFPMGLGIFGAALATAISPILGILISLVHFFHNPEKNHIKIVRMRPSIKILLGSCRYGISAFIGEFASGVTTTVFNYVILSIRGNIGIAAYGVIANLALVVVAVFNGIANGSQPLISERYARDDIRGVNYLRRIEYITSLFSALIIYILIIIFNRGIVSAFNSEANKELAGLARSGLFIYFFGFFLSGVNTVTSGYFSAVKKTIPSLVISLLRGLIVIVITTIVLGKIFGMNGVFASFPLAEFITFLFSLAFLNGESKKKR